MPQTYGLALKQDQLRVGKGGLPPLFLFNRHNLFQPSEVPLLAGEARGYKGPHNLQREFFAGNARAETQHIAVVMFARLMRGIRVTAERGANSKELVGGNRRADAAAANQNPDLRLLILNSLADL